MDPWSYDTDGDCYISESEKAQAIADWQSGIITFSDAMAVVNLWTMGTRNPACEPLGGWELLKSIDVTLTPPVTGGWHVLKTIDITLTPEVIGGWYLLKTIDVTLTPTGVEPECTIGETKCVGYDLHICNSARKWQLYRKNAAECGYVPSKFPWQWLAIGGAAIVGAILLIPKKAKGKIK